MTIPSGYCPTPDELAMFIDRQASEALRCRVLDHVDGCELCRELLAIAVGNSTVGAPAAPGTTTCTFQVGAIVGERYRVVRFIARGGMGEVYEARDTQLDESIALKTISSIGLDNVRLYSRLRREVQLARKVTHTNVCRILEFGLHHSVTRGEREQIPYLTMELLEGITLAQYAARGDGIGRREFLEVARQLVEGLEAVHRCGIVHRDLKPQNIIVMGAPNDATRRVVLTDFGLATLRDLEAASESSLDGVAVGTPAYMPPEQLKGEPPSPLWDIYALGLILYQLVAGRLPYGDQGPASVEPRGGPSTLSSVVPGFDPQLSEIVSKCLARRPARRYQSAAEVRRALQRAVIGIDVSVRRRRLRYVSVAAIAAAATWAGFASYPYLHKAASGATLRSAVSSDVRTPKSGDLVDPGATGSMSGHSSAPASTPPSQHSIPSHPVAAPAAVRRAPHVAQPSRHRQVGSSSVDLDRGHVAGALAGTAALTRPQPSSGSQAMGGQASRDVDVVDTNAPNHDGLVTPRFARVRGSSAPNERGD